MTLRQKEPRQKNDKHLKFIRTLPCVVCANPNCTEAAHVKMATEGKRSVGLGEKADDKWTVPLCSMCHRRQHAWGEVEFWETVCIDPIALATELFAASGDFEAGDQIVIRFNEQSLMETRHGRTEKPSRAEGAD